MPFVPDTAPEAASAPRGRFVPDAPPPAAPEPAARSIAGHISWPRHPWCRPGGPPAAPRTSRRPAAAGSRRAHRPDPRQGGGRRRGRARHRGEVTGGGVGGIGLLATRSRAALPKNMETGAQLVSASCATFTGRPPHERAEPQTEFGRTVTRRFDTAMAVFPSVTGVHGTLVNADAEGGAARGAPWATRRAAVGDAAAGGCHAAAQPAKAALAEGCGRGHPINLHQLTDSGRRSWPVKYAETIPGSGSKREQRRTAFTNAIARAIDPESRPPAITPDVFVEMQDKAGGGSATSWRATRCHTRSATCRRSRAGHARRGPGGRRLCGDLKTIADQNGGVVPGTVAQSCAAKPRRRSAARRTATCALRSGFVNKLDEGLSEVAGDADLTSLADARRRYAISTVIEPLVAKSPDGVINPQGADGRGHQQGLGSAAWRGKAGDLGDASGRSSSGTWPRRTPPNAAWWKALADVGEITKIVSTYPAALCSNVFGPKVAKKLIEAQKRSAGSAAPPPPSRRWAAASKTCRRAARRCAKAAGDLTPSGKLPGAAPAREGGVEPAAWCARSTGSNRCRGHPATPGAQIPLVEEAAG